MRWDSGRDKMYFNYFQHVIEIIEEGSIRKVSKKAILVPRDLAGY